MPRPRPRARAIANPTSVSVSVTPTSDQNPLELTSSRAPFTTSSGCGSTKGETSKTAITSFQMATIATIATIVLIHGRNLPSRPLIRSPLPADRAAPRPRSADDGARGPSPGSRARPSPRASADVARHRVERAERLVHEQDLGVVAQGPSDGDALAHAAGELPRERLLEALQADELGQLVRPPATV